MLKNLTESAKLHKKDFFFLIFLSSFDSKASVLHADIKVIQIINFSLSYYLLYSIFLTFIFSLVHLIQ